MTISVGDTIPNVDLKMLGPHGILEWLSTGKVLGRGRVVLFAVPGAFTPACSSMHLPDYVNNANRLVARGVDRIVCVAVNDPWVMNEWGKCQGVGDKILMLPDGNGDFTRAMGLELNVRGFGLGTRSQRYAAVIEGGVVRQLDIEPEPGVTVSACEAVLTKLGPRPPTH
jgi:glutaredoxin/glutathione-dependent peroxiredoxin